jgi:hypothetical protein
MFRKCVIHDMMLWYNIRILFQNNYFIKIKQIHNSNANYSKYIYFNHNFNTKIMLLKI